MNKDFQFDYSGIEAYHGHLCDEANLLKSSSGGASRAFASAIIKNGGVVFGVAYSDDYYSAEYCCIETLEDVDKIIGSKYIYSEKKIHTRERVESVYTAVAKELLCGREVLFFGLGCDIGAVRAFISKQKINDEHLYLVDLICQGPTYPFVQESYLKRLEDRFNSRIDDFSVRYKHLGWTPPYIRVAFENGKEHIEAFYGSDYGFAFANCSKPGCYQCGFRGDHHESDVTIGDYWGINNDEEGFNRNGVSIMLVRSEKGKQLLSRIDHKEFVVFGADIEKALANNPMYFSCRTKYANIDRFHNNILELGLHKAVEKEVGVLRYQLLQMRRKLGMIYRNRINNSQERNNKSLHVRGGNE